MGIETKEVKIAKEIDDVFVLVIEVIKHFRAGKSYAQMTELLDELMAAINGADQMDDEAKADLEAVLRTAGIRGAEIGYLFVKPDDNQPQA